MGQRISARLTGRTEPGGGYAWDEVPPLAIPGVAPARTGPPLSSAAAGLAFEDDCPPGTLVELEEVEPGRWWFRRPRRR